MASFLDSYQKITGIPGGRYLFNKLIGIKAPFFARIHPNVVKLEEALSVVEIKDRRGVKNHIGSVNLLLDFLATFLGRLAAYNMVATGT